MFEKNIEDLILEYVTFPHGTGNGWNRTFCKVCGDGTHAKGPRGGWLFSGDAVFYNCFNCQVEGNFDPDRDMPFSKDMRKIFDAFDIPKAEYNAIAYAKKINGNGDKKKIEKRKVEIKTINLPDYFCELSKCNHNNIIVKKALDELKRRNIDPSSYTFYLSTGKTKGGPKEEALARTFMNRLIIPYFDANKNLIYYQGRSLDDSSSKKYINCDSPRNSVMYGMDQLYKDFDYPLYVCEGFFDAFHLKGIALLENDISSAQLELLRRCRRPKIFVPDRKSDSSKVVDVFIKERWKVSVPEFGSSCKDVDDCIRKYGKLYTLHTVANNIHDADYGKICMQLNGFL